MLLLEDLAKKISKNPSCEEQLARDSEPQFERIIDKNFINEAELEKREAIMHQLTKEIKKIGYEKAANNSPEVAQVLLNEIKAFNEGIIKSMNEAKQQQAHS